MHLLRVWLFLGVSVPITALAQPDVGLTGPYPVREFLYTAPAGTNPAYSALVYYPAEPNDPARAAAAAAPMPVIVFGHGFLSPPELYRATCRHLASWGFAVIAPRTALELFPSHAAYAADLRASATVLMELGADPASPLFQRVDTSGAGFTGHSMGGGASLLAAAEDPRTRAVAVLAAAETRPSAIEAAVNIEVPVLYITGSHDTFTPNPFHTRPMMANTAHAAWMDIRGGFHCGFILVPLPQAVCDAGSITRTEQLAITHRLLTAYFLSRFRGDTTGWNEIWGPTPDLDRALTVRRTPIADLRTATSIAIPAGSAQAIPVTVVNRSATERTLTVAVDPTPFVATVTPPSLAVPPGQEGRFTVTFTAPGNGGTRRGVALLRTWDVDDPSDGGDYGWLRVRRSR
ncbi:MAG TPA: dienelactone hydrolase family protein [Kiritimatiellia bacterium]|nr:dienelactone hydrolase family protein [Kiritimatiellia bacterium]HMP33791.1 dienelactone hydrolase family protein [Kiritimatiellia bacterium]